MSAVLEPESMLPLSGTASARAAGHRRRIWRPATEIAIDLGTTNTLMLVKGEGLALDEPTVAAVGPSGDILGIGLEAKLMIGRTPAGIRAVRPMKDGVIADFGVTEKLLRTFLARVIDRHLF